jgi:hypothetical protein
VLSSLAQSFRPIETFAGRLFVVDVVNATAALLMVIVFPFAALLTLVVGTWWFLGQAFGDRHPADQLLIDPIGNVIKVVRMAAYFLLSGALITVMLAIGAILWRSVGLHTPWSREEVVDTWQELETTVTMANTNTILYFVEAVLLGVMALYAASKSVFVYLRDRRRLKRIKREFSGLRVEIADGLQQLATQAARRNFPQWIQTSERDFITKLTDKENTWPSEGRPNWDDDVSSMIARLDERWLGLDR